MHDEGTSRRAVAGSGNESAVTRTVRRHTASPLPLVSAVVTAYNYERYIAEALESALAQDYPPERLEVIVVDDGSTDGTSEIAQRYARDSGGVIRYVRQDNAGLALATSRGIQEARGEFITLLDADDAWVRSRTRLLVDALHRNPAAGLVYGDMEVIDSDGCTLAASYLEEVNQVPLRGRVIPHLLQANFVMAPALMVRASLRDRFCPIPAFFEGQDYYIAIRAAEVSEIDFVPAVVARYRRHGTNMSHGRSNPNEVEVVWRRRLPTRRWVLANLRSPDLTVEDLVAAFSHFLGTYKWVESLTAVPVRRLIDVSEAERTRAAREVTAGHSALARGAFVDAASHYVAALSDDPFHPDAVAGLENARRRLIVPLPRRAPATSRERPHREYHIKAGYVSRDDPSYFVDLIEERTGIDCHPDVYPRAANVAARLGATRVIDLGTGAARKLVALHPHFEILGVDYGPNLEMARRRFPYGVWIDYDLDQADPLPLTSDQLSGAVIVCANVIEQLLNPHLLLGSLRRLLDVAEAVVISTPERERTRGSEDLGPPHDAWRVREWSLEEFADLLAAYGFEHGEICLTRSDTAGDQMATILAILCADARRAERVRVAAAPA
jgi:glycosyltransferase involved in cell wall biosynthesis